MKFKRKNKTNKYLKIKINNSVYKNRNTKNKQYLKFILIFISFFAFAFLIYKLFIKKDSSITFIKSEEKIYFDKYDVDKYNSIKETLLKSGCSNMWDNQREFLNGLVRKFKPNKALKLVLILEVVQS